MAKQEYQHIVKWFNTMHADHVLVQKLQQIKFLVLDVDGALTDGNIEYGDRYEGRTRLFSTQDGYGGRMLVKNGFLLAIVTGKSSGAVLFRAERFGIPPERCIMDCQDKRAAVVNLQQQLGFTSEQTLMFGDDVIDAQVKLAQPKILFFVPCNAPFYVQYSADGVIPLAGGQHAFRLLLDLLLYVHGKHIMQDVIKKACGAFE